MSGPYAEQVFADRAVRSSVWKQGREWAGWSNCCGRPLWAPTFRGVCEMIRKHRERCEWLTQ